MSDFNHSSKKGRYPFMSGKSLPSTRDLEGDRGVGSWDHMDAQGPKGWVRWRRKKAATHRIRRRVLDQRVIQEQIED